MFITSKFIDLFSLIFNEKINYFLFAELLLDAGVPPRLLALSLLFLIDPFFGFDEASSIKLAKLAPLPFFSPESIENWKENDNFFIKI